VRSQGVTIPVLLVAEAAWTAALPSPARSTLSAIVGTASLACKAALTAMMRKSALRALGTISADEIPAQRSVVLELRHRPWPLPERPWLMGQTWYDLLFAHWAVDPEALRPLIPPPLELDVRDGRAWLGVTPFEVGGLRLRGLPPLPWLSRFPELNVRTYVNYDDRPGIYFFSLDAARHLAVFAARRAYRLPYFHAQMRINRTGDSIGYRSRRRDRSGPAAQLATAYAPSGPALPIEDGRLERWLAERYCVYVVDENRRALRGDIHHLPWPLQPATASLAINTMASPLGLELDGDPLLHYSARQDTLIWALAPA
jgi:uncharacterized protein YqjF (DUF2071 family)